MLDSRNIELWDNLNSIWDIRVEVGDFANYEVFTKNKASVIYVPAKQINAPSFAHEMLHIFLQTKDVRIGNCISLSIKEKPHLENVMSESLIDHIGNYLAHIKMLPIFIQMGYDRSEFLSDYHVNKLNDTDIHDIKMNFIKKSFWGCARFNKIYIDFYIGKYFAAKSCPNVDFDYSKGLNELRTINTKLYTVLDNLMSKWIDFDIAEIDNILSSKYFEMQFEFVDELERWLNRKRIVASTASPH